MKSSNINMSIPLDPDVFTWCTEERMERFSGIFTHSHEFMSWSGFLAKEIQAWIKLEILNEQLDSNVCQDVSRIVHCF